MEIVKNGFGQQAVLTLLIIQRLESDCSEIAWYKWPHEKPTNPCCFGLLAVNESNVWREELDGLSDDKLSKLCNQSRYYGK